MKKAIVVVYGKDAVGINYRVCKVMYEGNINILDIDQTIVSGYFNMMMVVDIGAANKSLENISKELDDLSKELNLKITIQLEETFSSMHRI